MNNDVMQKWVFETRPCPRWYLLLWAFLADRNTLYMRGFLLQMLNQISSSATWDAPTSRDIKIKDLAGDLCVRVSSVWSGSPRDILISFDSSEILYFCIPPAILGFWRSECVCTSSVILYPWCCGGVSSGILKLWLIWNVFPHVLVYSA